MVPAQIQLATSMDRKVPKRLHYPLEINLVCVRWYADYPPSLCNLEEMIAQCVVAVFTATAHRWAQKALLIPARCGTWSQAPHRTQLTHG